MMSHVPQLDVGLGRRNNWKHLVEELLERAPVHPPVPANQRAIAAAAAKSSFVDGLNSIRLMTLVA